jgi:hypothetical protein
MRQSATESQPAIRSGKKSVGLASLRQEHLENPLHLKESPRPIEIPFLPQRFALQSHNLTHFFDSPSMQTEIR